MLNTEKAQALFEKLSASKRESEEYCLKSNSHPVEIDPLTRKFQGMVLTQPTASATHQVEQEILALPILGPFRVHHTLYNWGASMNILPKVVYDCLDEDPMVPTPHQLQLVDSVMMQPYGIAKDVLFEFQDSRPWLISWSWIWILVS
jgi:hypothetical protein